MAEFGAFNWSLLAAYIVAILLLGFYLGRRVDSAQDFYLGKRTTPWWAIGISVVATYVSALSFLGGPAWSYTDGLSVLIIHMNYPLVIILVITLFLPFFYNSGIASIYDYQERRFGPAARSAIALIFLATAAVTSAAILYATSLVLEFITGLDVRYAILIVTAVALVYTMLGGITAVIWTDVIQAGILFIGAVIIFFALADQLPGGLGETLSALKAQGKTNPFDFSLDPSMTATVYTGLIAMTVYHVTVYGAQQNMVQRALAAKTIGDAKKSYLMMAFAAPFIYFLFMLLGILLYAHYGGREFANGNTIILEFAAEYGLPGLMGIIAAAVMAASMSNLDSAFNSMATVSTVDFYQKYFKKGASDAHYLAATRVFTLVWALAIIVPAIIFSRTEGSILEVLSKVGSYFVGAKLAIFGMGFFSRTVSERGLLIGVAASFVTVWVVAATTDVAWPWYCLIGAGANVVVALVASAVLDKGRAKDWHEYSVPGQFRKYRDQGMAQMEGGWYRIPGRLDRASYAALGFFACTLVALYAFHALI